jgi:hypothetical protein
MKRDEINSIGIAGIIVYLIQSDTTGEFLALLLMLVFTIGWCAHNFIGD